MMQRCTPRVSQWSGIIRLPLPSTIPARRQMYAEKYIWPQLGMNSPTGPRHCPTNDASFIISIAGAGETDLPQLLYLLVWSTNEPRQLVQKKEWCTKQFSLGMIVQERDAKGRRKKERKRRFSLYVTVETLTRYFPFRAVTAHCWSTNLA